MSRLTTTSGGEAASSSSTVSRRGRAIDQMVHELTGRRSLAELTGASSSSSSSSSSDTSSSKRTADDSADKPKFELCLMRAILFKEKRRFSAAMESIEEGMRDIVKREVTLKKEPETSHTSATLQRLSLFKSKLLLQSGVILKDHLDKSIKSVGRLTMAVTHATNAGIDGDDLLMAEIRFHLGLALSQCDQNDLALTELERTMRILCANISSSDPSANVDTSLITQMDDHDEQESPSSLPSKSVDSVIDPPISVISEPGSEETEKITEEPGSRVDTSMDSKSTTEDSAKGTSVEGEPEEGCSSKDPTIRVYEWQQWRIQVLYNCGLVLNSQQRFSEALQRSKLALKLFEEYPARDASERRTQVLCHILFAVSGSAPSIAVYEECLDHLKLASELDCEYCGSRFSDQISRLTRKLLPYHIGSLS